MGGTLLLTALGCSCLHELQHAFPIGTAAKDLRQLKDRLRSYAFQLTFPIGTAARSVLCSQLIALGRLWCSHELERAPKAPFRRQFTVLGSSRSPTFA